ncbi:MAG: Maf family protein [Pseudomonadales bacterium]
MNRFAPLVLASGSPRRADLLKQIGLPFEVRLPDPAVDESVRVNEKPEPYVRRLARAKALALAAPGCVVVAADTTVVLDDAVLGKPADSAEAQRMLLALAGRSHEVLTAVAVRRDDDCRVTLVRTRVHFRPISREEAFAYSETGEGMDKAGAYAIQGLGAVFVSAIEGSFSNVVGLPLAETDGLLQDLGVDTWALRRGAAGEQQEQA